MKTGKWKQPWRSSRQENLGGCEQTLKTLEKYILFPPFPLPPVLPRTIPMREKKSAYLFEFQPSHMQYSKAYTCSILNFLYYRIFKCIHWLEKKSLISKPLSQFCSHINTMPPKWNVWTEFGQNRIKQYSEQSSDQLCATWISELIRAHTVGSYCKNLRKEVFCQVLFILKLLYFF